MDVTPIPAASPILYVITKGTWGGAQRYVYELVLEARKRGAIVHVACGTPGELVRRLEEAQVPVTLIPGLARDIRLGSDVRAFLGLVSLIHRVRPAVVHCNSSKAGLIAALASRVLGIRRIIFTAHGWAWNELRPMWQKRIFKALHFLTVFFSHSVIAVSNAIKEDASWMPFVQKRFVVIHHGVSPLSLLSQNDARLFVEHAMEKEFPSSAIWIGALAELHPTKGLDVLLKAFAFVCGEFPEAILILIGEGEDRGRLTALAHMLKIEQRVHFLGHVKDGARILSALDVFVFPSYSEALGYVAIEAGQASLPVVASNVGGIPEIITDGVSGYLVPPGDPSLFAQKILELLKSQELRARFGAALTTRIDTDFSQEQMFEKTFALYS